MGHPFDTCMPPPLNPFLDMISTNCASPVWRKGSTRPFFLYLRLSLNINKRQFKWRGWGGGGVYSICAAWFCACLIEETFKQLKIGYRLHWRHNILLDMNDGRSFNLKTQLRVNFMILQQNPLNDVAPVRLCVGRLNALWLGSQSGSFKPSRTHCLNFGTWRRCSI